MWGTIDQSQLSYISFGQWLYHNNYTPTQTLENKQVTTKAKLNNKNPANKQPIIQTNIQDKTKTNNNNNNTLGQESVEQIQSNCSAEMTSLIQQVMRLEW